MGKASILAHMRQALHWSPAEEVRAGEALAAGLGMAIPVALGLWLGRPAEGFAAALGALGVAHAEPGAPLNVHLRAAMLALAVTLGAFLLVLASSGLGPWRDLILVGAAAIAPLLSGFSRPVARATTQFVIFLTIALAVPLAGTWQGLAVLGLVLAGAVFTSAMAICVAALAGRAQPGPDEAKPQRSPTTQQKLARWKRTLTTLAGWSYAVRLALGLAASSFAGHMWPGHHMHWIGLTVALLTPREAELLSVRTTQRAIGTAIGVAGTGLVFHAGLPGVALAGAVAVLACLRAWLRPRNYLAYSIVMTPLIILIIDGGRPPAAGMLGDRLLATLIGAVLVVALSAGMMVVAATTAPRGPDHEPPGPPA